MAIEVFNRYENKYLITKAHMEEIESRISETMEIDEYSNNGACYTVRNIYYDTEERYLAQRSVSKPKYKEKLRLRCYGVPAENDLVFLEIKKKYQGLVNKRRTSLTLKEACEFTESGIKPVCKSYMNRQVLNELEYFLSIYDLRPMVYIAYDRKAYFSKNEHDVRITFDLNTRTRDFDLRLDSVDYGDSLIDNDSVIMEVKSLRNLPVAITHMLADLKLYSVSFSKFGVEYMSKNGRKDVEACLNHYSQQLPTRQAYRLAMPY